jgi:hypothetical protein
VLKWKIIEGNRRIRARLTVRGFKDRQRDLYDTFAGTSTRWGQKAICVIAAQEDWPVWSADVSSAFLRGQTFAQIAKETGLEVRSVQFDMPQGSVPLLRQVPGFATFDPTTECLNMLKPVFGTNDAPWAWARELKKTLMAAGYKPTQADPRLYLRHVRQQLVGALSTHVDDLKCTSSDEEKVRLVKILEEAYEKLVVHDMPFEHCGIMHEKIGSSIRLSQDHYVRQLRPLADPDLSTLPAESLASPALHAAYRSLLGGLGWLTQTRIDVVAFVSRLQRYAAAPTILQCNDLNRLLKWVKRESACLTYVKVSEPVGMVCIADSAFRASDPDCLALRGAIIGMTTCSGTEVGGYLNILEFFCRKQTRVNRGTFGAELNNAVEATEFGILLQGFMMEVKFGCMSAQELRDRLVAGCREIPLHTIIDAHSVFTAVTAEEIQCPSERQLLYTLKSLRDHLDARRLDCLHRIDTRDMLSDCLTKGGVSRIEILKTMRTAIWRIAIKEQHHVWPRTRPESSHDSQVRQSSADL